MTIQRLTPEDWRRLRAIRLRALADCPDAFGGNLAQAKAFSAAEWCRRLARKDAVYFLAVRPDEADVGLINGAPYEGAAGLFQMWTSPAVRGQGLGRRLVAAHLAWAKDTGFDRALLDVGQTNGPAQALYRACGFSPTGETWRFDPPREHMIEEKWERRL